MLRQARETVWECSYGQTVRSMRDSGRKIKPMEMEDLFMLIGMSMLVSGLMTRLMDMESIFTLMVQDTMVNGTTISNKARAENPGQMELYSKETI